MAKNTVQPKFSPGLGLIWFEYKEINFAGPGEMAKSVTVNVPSQTQFVHIGITNVDMALGTSAKPESRPCMGIRFQTVIKSWASGKLDFDVIAQIAGDSIKNNWFGHVSFTIMCFG